MTDTATLLATLKEVKHPPPPEATAPWLLIVSALCLVLFLVILLRALLRKHNRWQVEAVSEIKQASRAGQTGEIDPEQQLARMATTLRRIALYFSDGSSIARTASGDDWLSILDSMFKTDYFSSGEGRIFGDNLYQPLAMEAARPHQIQSVAETLAKLIRRQHLHSTLQNRLRQTLQYLAMKHTGTGEDSLL